MVSFATCGILYHLSKYQINKKYIKLQYTYNKMLCLSSKYKFQNAFFKKCKITMISKEYIFRN